MTLWAPSARTQSRDSGRDAVPITVSPVSRRAICTAIEPTPPAAPMMTMASPLCVLRAGTSRRSNRHSQAVIAVSGSAAACANEMVVGMWPAMRSSTRPYSALLPGRSELPA